MNNREKAEEIFDKLFYVYLGQDDPRKSTMRKLERFGLVKKIDIKRASATLILTPFSETYITAGDRDIIMKRGVSVIDGSWNLISTISDIRSRFGRNLPLIVPVNPVNYGKPGKLSSVEAMCAALFMTGFQMEANAIISKFSWGQNFIPTNKALLEEYANCSSQQEIREVQDAYF